MINDLLKSLPEHNKYLETIQGKELYIIDWKDENGMEGAAVRQGEVHVKYEL